MSQRSIQQKRAAFALSEVLKVKQQELAIQKQFKAYSNSLPAMIQMNGLGQAMAFAYQKSNENQGWKLLFDMVSNWLRTKQSLCSNPNSNLLLSITEGSQQQYQLAQAEAQVLLRWIKDFTRAEISGEAEEH